VLPGNRFASNGSSRIAYEVCSRIGRRAPWLILIPGLGFDRAGCAPVIPALRRRFRLVLIDNRGSGRSTAQELAIRHPERVDRLVLACTTPGWPYGYPMPRISVQRMTEAASLPAEVAGAG